MYWFAHDMGAPGPPPLLVQEIQRRIAADPQLTYGLLRVLNHDVAPSKLFTPSLALAATSKALLTSLGQRKAGGGHDRSRSRAPTCAGTRVRVSRCDSSAGGIHIDFSGKANARKLYRRVRPGRAGRSKSTPPGPTRTRRGTS